MASVRSSNTRCPASGYCCTSACGSRRRRSSRYLTEKTGSRIPQTSKVGTSASVSSREAIPSRTAEVGWSGLVGISATKSSIA